MVVVVPDTTQSAMEGGVQPFFSFKVISLCSVILPLHLDSPLAGGTSVNYGSSILNTSTAASAAFRPWLPPPPRL